MRGGTRVPARPRTVDALLAAGVTGVLSTIVALFHATAEGFSGALAYVFAAGFGAVLLLRRSMPIPVLLLSVLGTFGYYILDLPPIGVALPVVAALFSAAERGLTRWAIGAGTVVFVVSVFFRLRDDPPPLGYLLGYDAVSNIALIAAGIALGYGVRARRIQAAQQAQISRLAEAQVARDAQSRIDAERASLSRELHDTIGHTMSVISLQASVGTEAIGNDDRAVGDALDRIRTASTTSLRELRSMVRMLRSSADDDQSRGVRSLSAVQELVDDATTAGIQVTTDIVVTPSELPAPVDAAAYRVLQESITNVVRHAGATRAHVDVNVRDSWLQITVTDNGSGFAATNDAMNGYGMVGMSERVRLLGGWLITHSSAGAGVTVEAIIPARWP